jgi:hypothetical protein
MAANIQVNVKTDKFKEGVLYAAGIIASLYDRPGIAAGIIREASLENYDCSSLDEFDKQNLRLLKNEKGIKFRNLF